MSFSGSFDPGMLGWVAWVFYLLFLVLALWQVPWTILLRERGLQHLFLGSVVLVAFLWQMRAGISYTVSIHLLLATTLTLMFYWPMALLATSIALLGVTVSGKASWDMFAINALIVCVLPVFVSHWVWRWVEWKLPANYFIFVLIAGGVGSALATLSSGLVVIGLTWLYTSAHEFRHLAEDYFLFLPLTLPPEAVVNGMILSGLTAYLPDWVRAFDPKKYLDEA
ncbi:energy-coupling factor ABC transporter permease [Marinospirillum alkaliphilum]|uniref:Uncharacterized membrane protein n=1 Tax=Marinospirillum alkaliphilum DSM 21637 TaxID=1122209 RepID=A0A1K1U3F2_9GAMM|nr:energy-coupling factor ABC transporter permease [Marinospirillum alkaliphilum]SFX07423.1 Uncharacterized membrane protein [Marinospirillum alkaliphilum DSM 21637]